MASETYKDQNGQNEEDNVSDYHFYLSGFRRYLRSPKTRR
jgi:hypothetical protein